MYADTRKRSDTVDSSRERPDTNPTVEVYTGNGDDVVYKLR